MSGVFSSADVGETIECRAESGIALPPICHAQGQQDRSDRVFCKHGYRGYPVRMSVELRSDILS
jgi:hypothetical protein